MNRSLAILVLLTIIAPMLPSSMAFGDQQADAFMQQVASKTIRTHSLSALLTVRSKIGNASTEIRVGNVYLEKPNLAHIENPLQMGPLFATVNSDGNEMWEVTASNAYRNMPADANGRNIQFYYALPIAYFFDPTTPLTTIFAADKIGAMRYLGKKVFHDAIYGVVEQDILEPVPYTIRLYIGTDLLLHCMEIDMPAVGDNSPREYFEADLSQVSLDQPIPANRFVYTLPPKATLYQPPNYQAHLLTLGSKAPNFSLTTMEGKMLTLNEALRGNKAIYLDFWFCDCMSCRQEFPELEKLYSSLKKQGLTVYAVNAFDDASKVRRSKSRLSLLRSTTFPILLSEPDDPTGVLKSYGIQAYPTGYLIDSRGNIVFESLGYDGKPGLNGLTAAFTKSSKMSRH